MGTFFRSKVLYLFVVSIIALLLIQPNSIQAKTMETKAETAIIVDVNTGKILFAKDENEALPPASMTKMMTEYIVLEMIDKGELNWDTKTQISDYAYSISANTAFSGVGLRQNVDYTVKSLYEAMAINSDNATTIALAELVAGSEGEFVKLMNQKAEELKLPDYKFVNSTGLDNDSLGGKHPEGTKANDTNLLSAKSAAILAYHLVNDYPEVLEISSIPETKFDGQEIRNWNWMLKHDATFLKPYYYEGVDGLKTGNTDLAGFTFTSTATKDDRRLITVVMKTNSVEERFKETAKLLDYGFSQFEDVEVFPAGYKVKDNSTIPVAKGKEDKVEVALKDGITIPTVKGTEKDYKVEYKIDKKLVNKDGELEAPIKKGEKVGVAELVFDGEEDFGYILDDEKKVSVDLVTTQDVAKKNWFSLMLGAIGQFFTNLYDKFIGLF
ncbi:serine hydrolase [Pseudogracilibacillus auburnensis]|uniref:serine-type D-Ala-D-Ala carboxypeptidase n=1 Tax=Pseudogracilibacillus auburnensis TaxID=1494959 RepID=A0A2V3VS93_9BACI|nr:serine hydrolase [Pseudogracilibacillus auburnensis]PXW83578.1 D-Ala-D-Ala carboxypeptidase A [Pseudogracilibacillus auburnensis]